VGVVAAECVPEGPVGVPELRLADDEQRRAEAVGQLLHVTLLDPQVAVGADSDELTEVLAVGAGRELGHVPTGSRTVHGASTFPAWYGSGRKSDRSRRNLRVIAQGPPCGRSHRATRAPRARGADLRAAGPSAAATARVGLHPPRSPACPSPPSS